MSEQLTQTALQIAISETRKQARAAGTELPTKYRLRHAPDVTPRVEAIFTVLTPPPDAPPAPPNGPPSFMIVSTEDQSLQSGSWSVEPIP